MVTQTIKTAYAMLFLKAMQMGIWKMLFLCSGRGRLFHLTWLVKHESRGLWNSLNLERLSHNLLFRRIYP